MSGSGEREQEDEEGAVSWFTRELRAIDPSFTGEQKIVYVGALRSELGNLAMTTGESGRPRPSRETLAPYENMRYNFETGIWSNEKSEKFKNWERVE